jgi:uncharacterized protein YlaI
MAELKCPDCPSTLGSKQAGRIKHNADGSHTFVPVTMPKAKTDPKLRGRRRA